MKIKVSFSDAVTRACEQLKKSGISFKKRFAKKNPRRIKDNDRRALAIALACIFSGTSTYAVLSMAASNGKRMSALKDKTPDYVRYASMGYAFDSVSEKKNIFISVTDGEKLCRAHLFTFDTDRHTLDILEIPPQTYISCGGFEGTLSEAYETEVYADILSRVLLIKNDGQISFESSAVSDCAALLGGIKVRADKPLTIGETTLVKGTRTAAGSVAGIIASDSDGYISGDSERILIYRRLLSSLILKLDERGAVRWASDLMSVIVNQVKTDIPVGEMIELINLCDKINISDMRLWLLPGSIYETNGEYVCSADSEAAAKLLNDRFRVKGTEYPGDRLSFADMKQDGKKFSEFEHEISKILK